MRRRPSLAAPVALLLTLLALLVAACEREAPPLDLGSAVPDAEVPQLYADLTSGDAAAVQRATGRIVALPDRRFVAPLIELLRASQWGFVGQQAGNARIVALEKLSAQSLGADWFAWAGWYQSTELSAPPGFASWKGALFEPIDPRFREFLRDEGAARIRVEEIDWGGTPVEGIDALDAPEHTAAAASEFEASEPVIGVALGGEARAYPQRVLDWHELVNDTLGGVPISLAYCSLCGSGVVYDARDGAGGARHFANSGLLYRSNKLFFDRETQTLWSQLTGEAALGPLAATPAKLAAFPSVVTTLGAWRARHPDTTVLSLPTGTARSYALGQPYGGYYQSPRTMFPVFERRAELPPKERVYGLARGAAVKAWRLEQLNAEHVVNGAVGGEAVVLVSLEGRIVVEGRGDAGFLRYDAGSAVRSYLRGAHEFRLGADEDTLFDEGDGVWRIAEDALVGPDGARAERVSGQLAYWFAWQAFHPDTEIESPPPREKVESDLEA